MNDIDTVREQFALLFGEPAQSIQPLSAHASARRMLRVTGSKGPVIAVLNSNQVENKAFIQFTTHFKSFGLPVPEIYHEVPELGLYFEQDLGDQTLYDLLNSTRSSSEPFPKKVLSLYSDALSLLAKFQIDAGATFNYSWCHQFPEYGLESMLTDMFAFREQFLKRVDSSLVTKEIDAEFKEIADLLLRADSKYFLYRDFQSRNIMVKDDQLFFIDYQGGRRGALQYDVVSLLYQASAKIPEVDRKALLEDYLDTVSAMIPIDRKIFLLYYQAFLASRMMQVLGVYGKQGLEQGKEYFRNNIPSALETLHTTLNSSSWPLESSGLKRCVEICVERFPV